ncbi:Rv3235 family protein [Solicola gregarius]|uniref:Rv3235 family protein n=1 Tax=Solicola gregarius TaxID=2908642 RepID=A0AA46TEV5_9ACTN|nr:Rv3235 family protein [Solicola gregarius]UYM04051.1 Rv3235 family protein [Solicola gregarius]
MSASTTAIELRVQRPPAPPRTPPAPVLPRLTSPGAGPRRPATRPTAGRPHTQMEARSRRIVQALVEIIDGARPASQMLRLATESVYGDLVDRLESLGGASAHGAPAGPLSTRVASVHVEQPADACAEISARIVQGNRSRALALRLDRVDGRWMCSAMNWG